MMRVDRRRRTPWIALVTLILIAAALRLHNLGAASLRGDEAFAIRYWAQSPAAVLSGLAWSEPHPFGTFFGFWAWKSLVGDSEFAMRMLPALINLLGIPAMYALTRRLLNSKAVALCAALLWAINPHLIWHSQDARNYAIWAALSAITLWLLLRAADRSRRVDWLLYIVAATLGLYVFFLEAFIVIVHGLYIAWFRRRSLRPWLISMLIVGVLLIPWFGQVWALAHSGYGGTAQRADFELLLTQFAPTLLFGEDLNGSWAITLNAVVVGTLILHFAGIQVFYPGRPLKFLLLLLLLVPAALLYVTATRLNVFLPRYLVAVTPALLIPLANSLVMVSRAVRRVVPVPLLRTALIAVALLLPFTILTVDALANYYGPYRKGADWRSLGDFLKSHVTAQDAIIITSPDVTHGYIDPAFGYYYSGPVEILPYPNVDTQSSVDRLLTTHRNVWVIPAGGEIISVTDVLQTSGMLILTERPGKFTAYEYRSKAVQPGEIASPLNVEIGTGVISGYSVEGERKSGGMLVVLLYWQKPPSANLKAFVHLIGPPKADGSPLWAQNDHPPSAPGRDVYLISLESVTAGGYSLEFGLYDPSTGQRSTLTDLTSGQSLGESVIPSQITIAGE